VRYIFAILFFMSAILTGRGGAEGEEAAPLILHQAYTPEAGSTFTVVSNPAGIRLSELVRAFRMLHAEMTAPACSREIELRLLRSPRQTAGRAVEIVLAGACTGEATVAKSPPLPPLTSPQ
jgi:hypothetical protein